MDWMSEGGLLLIGYEMFRHLLSKRCLRPSIRKGKVIESPNELERNVTMYHGKNAFPTMLMSLLHR